MYKCELHALPVQIDDIDTIPHWCDIENEFKSKYIPIWLKERITDQVGAMSVFSEEYSGGYDDALEWVLSLEE